MSEVIHVLQDSVINQIAAGEIVQRPAAVLKELIENSLDSGAKQIEILLQDAGKEALHVIDNGKGMGTIDARTCFKRHATSKINTSEDLQRISTFGFRGEALASIASVSQIELSTRRETDEVGVLLSLEQGKVARQTHIQTQKGSRFVVKNLFFNVPARRKFLRSASTEMQHLLQVFQQAALSQPQVAFTLHSETATGLHKTLYRLSVSTQQQRIISVLGKKYAKQLIPIEAHHPSFRLHGYVGKPEASSKTSTHQWLFVNTRYVRSRYLSHGISRAYEDLITSDRYPFFLVFIDIDPLKLDVNIHPTKMEVKFEDEQTIYALLQSAVKQGLSNYHAGTKIDFDLDANFVRHMQSASHQAEPEIRATKAKPSEESKKWKELQESVALESQYDFKEVTPTPSATSEEVPPTPLAASKEVASSPNKRLEEGPSFSHHLRPPKSNDPLLIPEEQRQDPRLEASTRFSVLHGRYVCKLVKNNLLLIDVRHAQERILYEQFIDRLPNQRPAQHLMFKECLPFSTADLAFFEEAQATLKKAGFIYKIEKESLELRALPVGLSEGDRASLFESILHALQQEFEPDHQASQKAFWRLMASKLAARQTTPRTEEEIHMLIERLFTCQQPNYTPTSLRTYRYLELEDLEHLFGK